MRKETLKIYQINELSKEAKEKALNDYRDNQTEIFWQEELFESLKALFNACYGVKLVNYSLGLDHSHIRIEFNHEETENLSGKRAFAWLENNLLNSLRIPFTGLTTEGSKRNKLSHYGNHYRAGMITPCAFTGYCADEDFIQALQDTIKKGLTLKEAFEGLAGTYEKILNAEQDEQNKESYIVDHMEANNYEFLENGKRY